jgi:hypothetical protein
MYDRKLTKPAQVSRVNISALQSPGFVALHTGKMKG